MLTTYKFRLYPTKEQEERLLWTLDKCRFVYNYLLEKKQKEKLKKYELQSLLPKLKREITDLQDVYAKVLQYENYRLHSNIFALHQLKKKGKKIGKLRFKGKGWFKTFSYNQSGFAIMQTQTRYDKLWLSKIGEIPFIMHRNIEGKIKQVTIKYSPSGKWYAFLITEIDNEIENSGIEDNKIEKIKSTQNTQNIQNIQNTQNTNKVGIDLGTINYVYDSDGNHFENPKHLDKSLEKLRKEQRKLSRKKKKSKNRMKQRIQVARIHEKITNQRDDFLHKLSRYYVNNYGYIAIEDLNIKGLIGISYNARNIMDASWSRFIQMLCYKAERAGCIVVKVEPNGTTQRCSNCGRVVPKELWNRKHKCICGLEIDRDYNSAINILNKALGKQVCRKQLGQELSEFTPVEIKPLLNNKVEQVWSTKQEAMPYRA